MQRSLVRHYTKTPSPPLYLGLKNSFRKEVQKHRASLGLDVASTNAPLHQMGVVSDPIALPDNISAYLCYAFQDVAFQHVEDRLKRALKYIDSKDLDIKSLVVVGGVAANMELRRRLLMLLDKRVREQEVILEKKLLKNPDDEELVLQLKNMTDKRNQSMKLIFPPVSLCTDNGVMIAWAGIEKLLLGVSNQIEVCFPM